MYSYLSSSDHERCRESLGRLPNSNEHEPLSRFMSPTRRLKRARRHSWRLVERTSSQPICLWSGLPQHGIRIIEAGLGPGTNTLSQSSFTCRQMWLAHALVPGWTRRHVRAIRLLTRRCQQLHRLVSERSSCVPNQRGSFSRISSSKELSVPLSTNVQGDRCASLVRLQVLLSSA